MSGQRENEADLDGSPDEIEQWRAMLQLLSEETADPDDCYFGLWEGWGFPEPARRWPTFAVMDSGAFSARVYYLFHGSLSEVEISGTLLGSGELVLVNGVGGRGNTNAWVVADPRARNGAVAQRAPRRGAPPSRVEQLAHAPAIVDVSDGVSEPDAFGQRCKALTGLGDGWVLALHLGQARSLPKLATHAPPKSPASLAAGIA